MQAAGSCCVAQCGARIIPLAQKSHIVIFWQVNNNFKLPRNTRRLGKQLDTNNNQYDMIQLRMHTVQCTLFCKMQRPKTSSDTPGYASTSFITNFIPILKVIHFKVLQRKYGIDIIYLSALKLRFVESKSTKTSINLFPANLSR